MSKIKKYIPWNLHTVSYEWLLAFYDNPRNFEVRDWRKEKFNLEFPENTVVLLTHWNFEIDSCLFNSIDLSNNDYVRLIKNFSDFWTKKAIIASWIPERFIIENQTSRLTWDANRSTSADDFIRAKDFSWNKLLDNTSELQGEWEKKHKKYHDTISKKMKELEQKEDWVIWFDIHDTWIRLMWEQKISDTFRKEGFPLISLWTKDGDSCNDEILNYFAGRLEYHLWIRSHINDPYKWWYVTIKHWKNYREENNTRKRNLIQVELGRFLYLKESTQEIDTQRMEIIWEWLKRAMTETWHKFWKEYFNNL